jgi:hypothetical protein
MKQSSSGRARRPSRSKCRLAAPNAPPLALLVKFRLELKVPPPACLLRSITMILLPPAPKSSAVQVSLPFGCSLPELLALLSSKQRRGGPRAAIAAAGLFSPGPAPAYPAGQQGGAAPPPRGVGGEGGDVASPGQWPSAAHSTHGSASPADAPEAAEAAAAHAPAPAAPQAGALASPLPSAAGTDQSSALAGAAAAMAAAVGSSATGLQKVRGGGLRGFSLFIVDCS